MATELDPRAARSYDALIAAMDELLDEREDPAAVKITEIVQRAGISRPTFYQHFADVPDLVRATTLHRLTAIFGLIPNEAPGGTWGEFAHAKLSILLGALQKDAPTYLAVFSGPAAVPVLKGVVDYLTDQILNCSPLGTVLRRELTPDVAFARAEFLGAGATWRVLQWLDTDFTGADELDAMVQRLSADILTGSGASEAELSSAIPTADPSTDH